MRSLRPNTDLLTDTCCSSSTALPNATETILKSPKSTGGGSGALENIPNNPDFGFSALAAAAGAAPPCAVVAVGAGVRWQAHSPNTTTLAIRAWRMSLSSLPRAARIARQWQAGRRAEWIDIEPAAPRITPVHRQFRG